MSDIVERLRGRAKAARDEKTATALGDALAFEEAANKIEATRRSASEEFEHYVRNSIDHSPDVLKKLGNFLASQFDEDRWASIDRMLLGVSTVIEAQRAEIARLREALEPFALVAEYDIGDDETDADVFRPMSAHNRAPKLRVGNLRRARAALKVSP